ASSHKVDEVNQDRHVNVSFADPGKQHYVSLSGTAQLVRDREKIEQLWNPALRAWFPDGLDDPDVALLKITVESAEYWDAPASMVAFTIGLAKALITGQAHDPSDHATV